MSKQGVDSSYPLPLFSAARMGLNVASRLRRSGYEVRMFAHTLLVVKTNNAPHGQDLVCVDVKNNSGGVVS